MRVLAHLLTLALLLAAGSGIYWINTLRERPTKTPATSDERLPDYYFTGFTAKTFERPGPPSHILKGERLSHYGGDNTADIRAPDLRYRSRNGAPWRGTAKRAHVEQNTGRIELIEDVVLREQPASGAPMTLRTSRMTVLTDAGRARTERRVEATGPGWRMAGRGMTARFERERVELHHDVDGRYEP